MEAIQSFEFGKVSGYDILNEDENYENYAKAYLKSLSKEKLAEPYESFKRDFLEFESQVSPSSAKLKLFKTALEESMCKKEILNFSETFDNLIALKKTLKKQFKGSADKFESIDESMRLFFDEYLKHVQEECEDADQHRTHVEN